MSLDGRELVALRKFVGVFVFSHIFYTQVRQLLKKGDRGMKYLSFLLLLVGLVACGGNEDSGAEPASKAIVPEITVAVEGETGEQQMTVGRLPDGFPLPVPDDIQIGMSAGLGNDGYSVTLIYPAERADEIAEFYREVFADTGYLIEKDSPRESGGAKIGARKGDMSATADISNRGGNIMIINHPLNP